jgi:hypothetical protein
MLMLCQRAITFTKMFIQIRTMSNYVCLVIYELPTHHLQNCSRIHNIKETKLPSFKDCNIWFNLMSPISLHYGILKPPNALGIWWFYYVRLNIFHLQAYNHKICC